MADTKTSSLSFEIRPYLLKDRAAVIQAIDSVCGEGRWMMTQRYLPTPAWEHAFSEPGCTCHSLLVAECHTGVIRWCRVFAGDLAGSLEIGIGILKKYRNHGIGSALLDCAVRWAEERAPYQIYALAYPSNRRARHLFHKYSFHPVHPSPEGFIKLVRNAVQTPDRKS